MMGALLSLDELTTIITEIEAILNSRPLTFTYDDLNEPSPISPSILLTGKLLTSLPDPLNDEEQAAVGNIKSATRRLEYRNHLVHVFWLRWRTEYLQELQKTNKKFTPRGNPKINDVCLVEDSLPKQQWKMAKIEKLITGRDGLTRAAVVKTRRGLIQRPIQRLYPLECEPQQHENEPKDK